MDTQNNATATATAIRALNADTRKAIVESAAAAVAETKAKEKNANKSAAAADLLWAAGYTRVTDFISPVQGKNKDKSTATEEEWELLRSTIINGFPVTTQRLLILDTSQVEGLSEKQKTIRSKAQTAIGSITGTWKRSIARKILASYKDQPADSVADAAKFLKRPNPLVKDSTEKDTAKDSTEKDTAKDTASGKSAKEKIRVALSTALSVIQGDENPDYPVFDMVALINKINKMIE